MCGGGKKALKKGRGALYRQGVYVAMSARAYIYILLKVQMWIARVPY